MKFTDGNWLVKKGISIYGSSQVVDVKNSDKEIFVYVTTFHVRNRGDTLGGPMITLRISSPVEDVIRIQAYHFKGNIHHGPDFFIKDDNLKVHFDENNEFITVKSGDSSLKINKNDFQMDFIHKERHLTKSGYKSLAYITSESGERFMREQLDLDVGEYVYGLGERFTNFVKNGQVIDMWNADAGTNSEQSYKNIPFYLTNKKYGVFVNNPGMISYEIASERVSKVQFSVNGESIDYLLIVGESIKEVLEKYTYLTGKPALPPAWSFGLWLTTSFTTDYNEETATKFVDGMLERDIPLKVFHFDCFWMKEFQWTDLEWDRNQFRDPEGMLKRFKDKGLKISVWINPYIAQKSKLFDEAMQNGYLLKSPNGSVWQSDMWQPGMGIIDFTNPDAKKWFSEKLKELIEMGVDCFKTDFGERIPTDVVYYDNSDPERMHNYYTYLYNKTVFEATKEKKGEDALVFARSATAGSQKFPVHWGGDCSATYESMAESLRGGLSLGLCGFGFWSHDIAGFESRSTPDLYKRWTAFGLLSSHSRLHGNNAYKVPWLYDEESVDVLRFFSKLKNKLMPYIYSKAVEASRKGIPVMRPMMVEFDDPTCLFLDKQYMIGDALLVAPIFSEDGTVTYYLPKGRWMNFITKEIIDGGRWKNEKHGYMSLPLMMRENTIIATGNVDSRPDYDYADNVTFHLFGINETFSEIYDTNGNLETQIKAKRKGQLMDIEVKKKNEDKKWNILIYEKVRSVINGDLKKEDFGYRIIPKGENIKLELEGEING
ncbi:alpha-xylosidase [Athalassotoga saccharophila]|uniref:alpha-xylosidase n=1 Tax=Athalassotoga saccharophila TaxID=1441386 RepID=UPI001379E5AF|nr:alpha-xylosidase [Athalassotoga saccharophila]BBJ27297.1 alpha-xylosidase [Athalassotoga saccharophila]